MEKDLVCGMETEGEGNRYFTDYDGKMYYFCSPECKRQFDDHPDTFIQENARRELGLDKS